MGLGEKIPKNCNYWRFQGDHNMIGCQLFGYLCSEDCDPDKIDPKRFFRDRIDKQRKEENMRQHNI